MQIEYSDCWKTILSNFLCPSSFICLAIAAVKKEKSQMSFKSIIGPSHPISEIATSHVCGLKRLETRVIKNYVFFESREWGWEWVSSGLLFQWGRRTWHVAKIGPSHPILWYVVYSKMYCFDWLRLIDCMK